MTPDGYKSFIEILSFYYAPYKSVCDLQSVELEKIEQIQLVELEKIKQIQLIEQDQIDETQKLVGLVESNKVFFKDDYERVIPLLSNDSEAYREILKRLKHHIEMLKGNNPPWIKEAYWFGTPENQREFGYGDGDTFDILHFYYLPTKTNNGRRDIQIKEILKVINELKLNPMEIPEGYKKKIKARCVDSKITFSDGKLLFTDKGFDNAWIEANKRELISIKDKKKYLKNHNSP